MKRWRSLKIVTAYLCGLHTMTLGLIELFDRAIVPNPDNSGVFGTVPNMAIDTAAALVTSGVAIMILTGMHDK